MALNDDINSAYEYAKQLEDTLFKLKNQLGGVSDPTPRPDPSAGPSTPTPPPLLVWPNHPQHRGLIVNATQGLDLHIKTHPDRFKGMSLILDLEVTSSNPHTRTHNEEVYTDCLGAAIKSGIVCGTYISGTNWLPEAELTSVPPNMITTEQLEVVLDPDVPIGVGSWSARQPNRKMLDARNKDTSHAIIQCIERVWDEYPAPVRFVDNAAQHVSAGGTQDWAAQMTHLGKINGLAYRRGERVAFNISTHVGAMNSNDLALMMGTLHRGMLVVESGLHPNIAKTEMLKKQQREAYRLLLDNGVAVCMGAGLDATPPADVGKWVRGWCSKEAPLYIMCVFWKDLDMAVVGK